MLTQLKKIFTFNDHEADYREREISATRIYFILFALLIPIFILITYQNHHKPDLVILILLAILFFLGFLFSSKTFTINTVKENLPEISIWLYILTSVYAIYATYQRNFSIDYSFGLTILFFVFALVLKNVKHIVIYFAVIAAIGIIALFMTESPEISKPFLSGFFLIFFCVGFFAIRTKALAQLGSEQRENFLKSLFNQTYDAIMLVNFYSREVVECNDATITLFEVMSKDEITGFKPDKFEEKKMTEEELVQCRRELAQNGIWKNETGFITKKGKRFWGEIVITPLNIGNTQYYVKRVVDITPQRIIKDALRENEEHYRTIFKSNPQPVWIYDRKTLKFIDVNDEAIRIYGYSLTEFLKMTILDIRPEEEKEKLLANLKIQQGINGNNDNIIPMGDWKHLKKDGTSIIVEVVRAKINLNGKEANLAIIKDVTAIRTAEKALQLSEERFKRLSAITTESITIHDNGKILEVNSAFCKLFGYTEREAIGMNGIDFAAPESREMILNSIKNKNEKPYEILGLRKDGSTFIAEVKGKTIPYNDSEARVAVIRDITAQKTAEQLLIESEKKHRNLVENMPKEYFFYSHDTNGVFYFLSPTITGILGYSAEEFMKHYTTYLTENPINREVEKNTMLAMRGLLQPAYEVEIFHKNRSRRWLEVVETPVFDEKGTVISVEGLARDITNQRCAEEKLRESQDRLNNFMNSATDIFSLFDEKFRLIEVNEKGIKLLGKAKEELLGKDLRILSPEIEKNGLLAKYEEVMRTGLSSRIYDFIFWNNPENRVYVTNAFKVGNGFGIIGRDITERRMAELQIIESEKNYRNLVELSPDGILILNDEKIEYANPKALHLLGHTDAKNLLSVEDVVSTEYLSFSALRRQRALDGEEVPFAEIKVKRAGGGIFEIESKQIAISYKGKKAILVVLHDLTPARQLSRERLRAEIAEESANQLKKEVAERMKVEKLLIESQKYTGKLIESSLDIICASDKQGNIIEFNSAAVKAFGYEPEQIIGRSAGMLYASNEQHHKVDGLLRGKEGGFRGEVINVRRNGEQFISFLSASALKDEEGNVMGFMGVSRDITEQKKSEKKLVETQKFTQSIISSSLDMIIACDRNGKINVFNESAQKTFGYQPGEIMGGEITGLYGDVEQHKTIRASLVNTGTFSGEIINKRRDGNYFFTFLSASSLKNQDGEIIGFMGVSRDITEQKRSEQKLEESQHFTESIISSSLDMIIACDRNGKITVFNDSAQKTFGYQPGEIIGKDITMLYEEFEQHKSTRSSLLKSSGTFSGEIVNLRKNGKKFFTYLSASSLKNQKGEIIGFMGVSRDITEIKKSETALRESEERYRDLFENATDLIQSVDANGKIQYVNKSWMNTLGYNEEELKDVNIFDLIHPDCKDHCREIFSKIFKGEKVPEFEIVYSTKDHKKIIASGKVSVKAENGKIISTRGIFRDITKSKEAHELLVKFKKFFDLSFDMVCIANTEGYFKIISPSFSKVLGYSEKELLSKKFIAFIHPEDVSATVFEMDKLRNGQLTIDFINRYRCKDGTYLYFQWIAVPDVNAGEIFAIARNITEMKQAEELIIKSLQEKEVLLKEVHHRVKNNMQVISSILNLQTAYVKDKKTLEILNESQNRIKTMAFIHESLYQTKDFSKIDLSEYILNLTNNLVHSYQISEMQTEFKADINKGISLTIDQAIPCGLIINELVSNAFKYAFPGKTKGRVSLKLRKRGKTVRLVIGDNGIGIPERINFRNTESLGLQLVLSLIEQLDGTIKIERDKGTKFFILFEEKIKKQTV